MTILSPFVYWGQTKSNISLKVDLREAENPLVKIDDDGLKFSALAVGLGGHNQYEFNMDFYAAVQQESCKFKVTDTAVEIVVLKEAVGEIWPRLSSSSVKIPWLKPDFNKFEYEDDSEEEPQDYQINQKFIDNRIKEASEDQDFRPEFGLAELKMCYLVLYNMFQWVGFSAVFSVMVMRFIREGTDSMAGTYDAVVGNLMICQLVACLEVIHPMIGLVKTGVLPPFLQVFGRNLVLFIVIAQEKRIQEHYLVFLVFITWSSVELFRYPFYILNSLGVEVGFVTYLRYTVWIPLYPAGALFEVFTLVTARPYFLESGKWSTSLPNKWNISFDFPTFIWVYTVILVTAMQFMLRHMYISRQRKLNPKKKLKTA